MAPRSILVRPILVSLLLLIAFAIKRPPWKRRLAPDPPSFLYTVAKHYEPLAWMHGADRFQFRRDHLRARRKWQASTGSGFRSVC